MIIFRVRIKAGRKSALLGAHLGYQPGHSLADNTLGQRVTAATPPVRVRAEQQSIVVQHFLEVRHYPRGVNAVAGESAADLVIYPASRHRFESLTSHQHR